MVMLSRCQRRWRRSSIDVISSGGMHRRRSKPGRTPRWARPSSPRLGSQSIRCQCQLVTLLRRLPRRVLLQCRPLRSSAALGSPRWRGDDARHTRGACSSLPTPMRSCARHSRAARRRPSRRSSRRSSRLAAFERTTQGLRVQTPLLSLVSSTRSVVARRASPNCARG